MIDILNTMKKYAQDHKMNFENTFNVLDIKINFLE